MAAVEEDVLGDEAEEEEVFLDEADEAAQDDVVLGEEAAPAAKVGVFYMSDRIKWKLAEGGYSYTFHTTHRDGEAVWRCDNYRKQRCRASVVTPVVNNPTIIRSNNVHTCVHSPALVDAKITVRFVFQVIYMLGNKSIFTLNIY